MFDVPIRYWIQMSSDCNWNRTQNHLVRKRTLSGSGFESSYSHLNFRFCDCFKQGVLWHSGNYRVWIHSETLPWHDKNILPNVKVWYIYKTAYRIQAKDKKKSKLTNFIWVTPKIQNIKIAYQKKHYWFYREATQTRGQKHADKRALHKSTHIKRTFDKSAHDKRAHDFY